MAREYRQPTWRSAGKASPSGYGFRSMLREILGQLKGSRPEIVVFAPFSFPAANKPSHSELFPRGSSHRIVVIETRGTGGPRTEVYFSHKPHPVTLMQYFATSKQVGRQRDFRRNVDGRRFGRTLLMLCGETNIVGTREKMSKIVDEHRFRSWLKALGIKLILNPVHSFMKRPEMRIKREALSKSGALLVSVWNRGLMGGGEAGVPWAAYLDGDEISDRIKRIASPSHGRSYWIGLVKV
ncbi:MAG: hypothetical protein K2X72_38945 [Reyranella sp.]|nr:hypothetical protein [Reyranella sp.]